MPLRILVHSFFSVFEVWDLHISYSNLNLLRNSFIFKFVLLHHILVVHTKIFSYERLNFNTFSRTYVHFIIVILTWHDFTSYSLVLPTSISYWIFSFLSINCRCIIFHKLNCIYRFWHNFIMASLYLISCFFNYWYFTPFVCD